jgi:hypothetical protein
VAPLDRTAEFYEAVEDEGFDLEWLEAGVRSEQSSE